MITYPCLNWVQSVLANDRPHLARNRVNLGVFRPLTNLPRAFDTPGEAGEHDDPGHDKTYGEFPLETTEVTDTGGPLKDCVPDKWAQA